MRLIALVLAAAVAAVPVVAAQDEKKPVPKDSARVSVAGCSKGYMFTAGPRAEDQSGTGVPEGMHLRMNGPRKLINDIKAHEGSRVEITGLIRKGQYSQQGLPLGGGVRIGPGPSGGGGIGVTAGAGSVGTPVMIDVEGWRQLSGDCSR
jgi:hypothetical protein